MNLLFQTFISIGTFHNLLNYVHNDTHSGNFLYQTNNEKGYYEYSFNGKSYYLKSCAYNIMICDFGLAKDVMNKNKIKDDYATISNVFFNKKNGGLLPKHNLPSAYVNETLITIKNIVINTKYDIKKENIYNEYFENIIEKIFIPFSPKGLWLTERPNNVINKKAFDIS